MKPAGDKGEEDTAYGHHVYYASGQEFRRAR